MSVVVVVVVMVVSYSDLGFKSGQGTNYPRLGFSWISAFTLGT
jgi:hypothetical protein